MKIAITGGTAGIGQALGNEYEARGHEVLRISRRTGHNIRVTPKLADVIEPCDMFVNNAQVGFAQTELLFEMVRRWTGTRKQIIVVSTMMTQLPVSHLPGLDMDAYRNQKVALEEAVKQLRHLRLGVDLIIVRPGMVGTTDRNPVPPAAEVDVWASTLIHILEMANANGLTVPDISLGPIFK